MLRKAIQLADGLVNKIVACLCLILFLICLYATIDAMNVYMNATDSSILKYKPALGQASETLREISDEAVAWLTIDGTSIDYPIMQGANNDVYLNKDPFGDFSLSGSIFLDSRNSGDFSDPYSLVYGHHMEHGAMFGALDAFKDASYASQHRTGTLMTAAGKDYKIRLFACCKAPGNESVVFDPAESSTEELLRYLEENASAYDPEGVSPDSKILALSTCQAADTIERLILFGVLTEIGA